MPFLKLATFNINNIVRRLPCLLQWLEKESPDIVCLQELKAADDRFPAAALSDAGYGARWRVIQQINRAATWKRPHGVIVGCLYHGFSGPQEANLVRSVGEVKVTGGSQPSSPWTKSPVPLTWCSIVR